MPIPKPTKGQTVDEFVDGCMADPTLTKDFPDAKQRAAVCHRTWDDSKRLGFSARDLTMSGALGVADWFSISASGKNADGEVTQRFRKAVIRVGKFFKDTEKKTYKVTANHLRHWADTFQRMKASGTKVWIPSGHNRADDPDAQRGYVDELFVGVADVVGNTNTVGAGGSDGGGSVSDVNATLFMNCTMIGEDGVAAARRNDVSIFAPESFTNDKGEHFVLPIRHIALCPDPVVTGLGEFIPIAASSGRPTERNGKLSWENVAKALGCHKDGQTEKTAEGPILESIGGLKANVVALSAQVASKPTPDPTKVEKEKEKEASSSTLELPPQVRAEIKAARETMVDTLVTNGNIVPAVATGLKTLFIGDKGEQVAISLSSGEPDTFQTLVKLLAMNDPVSLKEVTKAQTKKVELSQTDEKPGFYEFVQTSQARAKAN